MPVPKGVRIGGRQKGTPNKFKFDVLQACRKLGLNPFEVMAHIAAGQLSCGTCFAKGTTKYKSQDGSIHERLCESCYGTLREKVSTGDRLKASEALGKKLVPDLKSVEHSGTDGGPIQHAHTIKLVR